MLNKNRIWLNNVNMEKIEVRKGFVFEEICYLCAQEMMFYFILLLRQ